MSRPLPPTRKVKPVTIAISDELRLRLDEVAGRKGRAKFVRDLIKKALQHAD